MVVLTILAAGLLVPLTTNIESKRYEATQKVLAEANEALIGYAMSHSTTPSCTCNYVSSGALDSSASTCPYKAPCPGSNPYSPNSGGNYTMIRHYLPCPDKTSAFGVATNFPNDGKEDRNGAACEVQEGNLPWVDLGVGRTDAWGNHLHYSVTDNATTTFSDKSSGFTSASSGDKIVCNSSSCATIVASQLPAVILSYGKNGKGALHEDPLATQQAAPNSDDERENIDMRTTADPTCCKPGGSGTNDHFVSHSSSEASATTSEFDDLVVWLPSSVLVSRVCPAGGCL
jgi:type II secretory pathway pseudopilin PulG